MSSYMKLHSEAMDKLRKYQSQHASLLQQHDNYKRFINETGRRNEYLRWMAKAIGIDDQTIAEIFSSAEEPGIAGQEPPTRPLPTNPLNCRDAKP